MIHVCKNPEMGGGFDHFLAHGLIKQINIEWGRGVTVSKKYLTLNGL